MSDTWPTNAHLHTEHNRLLADHRETMTRVANLRDDLNGTNARLIEVDNELGTVRAALSTARHAIVELDDALTALRAEHAADKPARPKPLRQFTPYELADQAIGLFLEYRDVHGRVEEDARREAALEVAEGAAVTSGDLEPDEPAPANKAATARHCSMDTVDDCPNLVVWRWWPNGRPGESVLLCDEHAAGIDLSELEDLRDPEDDRERG